MSARPLWKRILQFALIGIAAIAAVLTLTLFVVFRQSRSEWDNTKKALALRGEKISIAELAPPRSIPDGQNFFADPLWTELIERRTVDANGKVSWKASVPKEQMQIHALRVPLTDGEREALKAKLPEIPTLDATGGRYSVADDILTEADKSPDPKVLVNAANASRETLAPLDPLLNRVHELLRRPDAYFPVDYERGLFAQTPHVSEIIPLAGILSSRARAALILGDPASARRDIIDQLRLAEIVGREPTLIAVVLRQGITSIAFKPIRFGIQHHVWTDPDLVALQSSLLQINLLPSLSFALRGERALANIAFENLRKKPDTFFASVIGEFSNSSNTFWRQVFSRFGNRVYMTFLGAADQAFYNDAVQKYLDTFGPGREVTPALIDALQTELEDRPGRGTRRMISNLLLPAISGATRSTVKTQDQAILVGVACALERFRLKNQTYPDALAAFVPTFLPEIPADIIAGQSLHYRIEAGGGFQLWFNGWNGVDENGIPGKDARTGDWSWNPPPKRK